jgi:hypothetical protein
VAIVVNDLVTKFSFLGSVKPLGDYNVSLGGSIKLLGGMALGLSAGAAAFGYWTDGVLGGVDALSALSRESGVSVAAIQELNFAAGQTQSSAGAMESTINSLSKTIGDAAQKGSDDFARLGISVRDAGGHVKNADTILGEVSNRFKALNLSISEQKSFASALGIDTSLLQLLGKTSVEMAAMRDRARELGTLTAEQTEQAALYKQSLSEMWFGINAVNQLVAVGFAPTLQGMAEDFTDLIANNKDWIVNGIQATIEWVGNLVDAFNRLLPVFALIGAGFLAMKIAALGFGGAMALAFAPVTLTIAGITALLLIVDDLIVAFSGGKSVIADFFKDTFDIDIVDALANALQSLIANVWDPLVAGFDAVAGFFGLGADTTMRTNIPADVNATQRGATVDNRRIDQSNQINIYTPDAEAAGRAVGDNLQKQLDNANTQLDTGGR